MLLSYINHNLTQCNRNDGKKNSKHSPSLDISTRTASWSRCVYYLLENRHAKNQKPI